MNLRLINKYPTIKKWLIGHLGYYANGMRSFSENKLKSTSNDFARIVIVAKCHYSESWQSFSSVNKKDLQKIIQLKKSTQSKSCIIFQSFENKTIDGFDIKITTFDQDLINELGANKILIPETELFNHATDTTHVFQLDTIAGTLFSGGHGIKTMSSYAKGVLADIEMYKLSAGLPQNAQSTIIEQKYFADFLINQLLEQRLDSLIKRISVKPKEWVNINKLHILYWAPLLTALCFYLVSNSYLFMQTIRVEEKLAEGGEQVSTLLEQKQRQEQKRSTLALLSTEFKNERLVHNYWEVIYHLVECGMKVTRISYNKGQLVIRGNADKASEVLSGIAKNVQVKRASFEGPVRKSRGRDNFILTIMPKES